MSNASLESHWQPIETAPVGPVLLFVRDRKDPTYLPSYPDRTIEEDPYIVQGVQYDGEWYDTGGRSLGKSWSWVTHWMPLPPPPAPCQGGDPCLS